MNLSAKECSECFLTSLISYPPTMSRVCLTWPGLWNKSGLESEASRSVRASAASGDALIGGGPARIEREAGLVDINDQRSMIRGYGFSFACLTVDLGPDDARL